MPTHSSMTIPKIGSEGEQGSATVLRGVELEGEQPPAAARMELEHQLKRLGETLKGRTEDVVSGIIRRNEESAVVLEPIVEESFVKVGTVSTVAFARWTAGEGAEVAREVGHESWNIFGQL